MNDINAMLANQIAGNPGEGNTQGDSGQTPDNNPEPTQTPNDGAGDNQGNNPAGDEGTQNPTFIDGDKSGDGGGEGAPEGEGSQDQPNIPENLDDIISKKVDETLSQKQAVDNAITEAKAQHGDDAFDEQEVRAAIAKGTDPQIAIYAAIGLKNATQSGQQGSVNMSGRVPSGVKNFTAPQNMSDEDLTAAASDELNNLMSQA